MMVPVITPVLALMVSPDGAPEIANVHGEFEQVYATGRLTTEPIALAWFGGAVTVGPAFTLQLKALVDTATLALSVMVTTTLL